MTKEVDNEISVRTQTGIGVRPFPNASKTAKQIEEQTFYEDHCRKTSKIKIYALKLFLWPITTLRKRFYCRKFR
ncbi:hypothetical protein [Marinomonas mediterranea]|jgi:hypothetical protein|uniref:Uncharacterized protein n=1 Tax=Marinomonas mediterranea (strain ATCC 700492 / JCM 21426 / NBRC 103028 / MMB-1) TaxID=717774 RepID=F2K306_MARM1|nr:hypothetical protein [Marinomonas mediterranea]ADZ92395.1 hypothetical protein Marme_3178 [Marinomonas mediterranea MMB-1]WCN10347.1 hypothetical protein GV055_16185 [Marinomonas mediterranea]WCN14393.1 hypothetical protein GV054_16010 [Marinomonas mediterranea]WCN18445.1 hypothetical protein GV053_16075 [Marinomonas mediterranea MMB-1]